MRVKCLSRPVLKPGLPSGVQHANTLLIAHPLFFARIILYFGVRGNQGTKHCVVRDTASLHHGINHALLFFLIISVCQYACHVSCTDQAPPVCPIPHSQSKDFLTFSLACYPKMH